MFEDRQIKKAAFGKWLASPVQGPRNDDSLDRYAGLCLDAHEFSDQLNRLRKALSPIDDPLPQDAVEVLVKVHRQPPAQEK
jgi:hypothetical protein